MRVSYVVAALVLAVVVILAVQYWPSEEPGEITESLPSPAESAASKAASESKSERQPPQTQEPFGEPVASPDTSAGGTDPVDVAPPEPAPITLPGLHDSDDFVRDEISAWGLPDLWTEHEALVARLAVVVSNAADGAIPRAQLDFLSPSKPFKALKRGDKWFVDGASYERFDGLVDVLLRVPADSLAKFVVLIEPLIDDALRQLGRHDGARPLIVSALQRVRRVPIMDAEVELIRPVVVYQFADPQLEGLPEFEKQLLRTGPANVTRIQNYARAFANSYAVTD